MSLEIQEPDTLRVLHHFIARKKLSRILKLQVDRKCTKTSYGLRNSMLSFYSEHAAACVPVLGILFMLRRTKFGIQDTFRSAMAKS